MNECVAKGNDFSMWDNDKDLIFDREDKNGTRYYVTNKCPRCDGTGWLHEFEYVDGGICFMCHGSGFAPKPLWTKVYREEYHAKLIEKRQAKWKARAEEDNAKFFKAFGFSPKGEAWVVLGDTYSQKDALKEQGARFSEHMGWYFDHKPEMDSVHLEPDTEIGEFDDYDPAIGERKRTVTFMDVDYTGHYNLTWYLNVLKEYIDEKQDEYQALHTESGAYIGAVGDKITLEVVYDGFSSFERDNPFGYCTTTMFVERFKDENGNMLVWITSSMAMSDIKEGDKITLTGTVKDHREYRHVKQTVLIRCKCKGGVANEK